MIGAHSENGVKQFRSGKEMIFTVGRRLWGRSVWIWICLVGWAGPVEASTIFSFNGVGDAVRRVDVRTRGMGGAGRAVIDGENFSSANPALLAAFLRPSLSSLYSVQRRSLNDGGQNHHTVTDGDMGAFQLVLPVRRGTALGIGLEPITDLDFGLVDTVGTGSLRHELTVEGSGGIQALSLGIGQRAGRKVYLGARVDLIAFGTINETWTKDYDDPSILFSQDLIVRTHRGFVPTFGAVYTPSGSWSLGLNFQIERTVKQTRKVRNIFHSLGVDTEVRSKSDIQIPFSLGGGVVYSAGYRWLAALDAERAFWGRAGQGRHDTVDLSGGLLYRTGNPDLLVQSRRIELTAGAHYRSLYFQTVSGLQISEVGGSLGVALPLGRGSSKVRYVVEFGKRGDVGRSGVSERFILQTVSFSGWIR